MEESEKKIPKKSWDKVANYSKKIIYWGRPPAGAKQAGLVRDN